MTNLKTLKDLVNRGSVTINSGKRLRGEAIKWVQYYLSFSYKEIGYTTGRFNIKWIKHFFNITEEDLK